MRNSINKSRRNLIKALACLPVAPGVSMLSSGSAQAMSCSPAGKSLVCIFLAGGADSFNMFVPGSSQDLLDYQDVRGELAVDEGDLIEVTDPTLGTFGFNQQLDSLARLYQENRLAVVSNTGTLIRPTTKSDFLAQIALPESLFAHNTQQKLWQTGAGIVSGSNAFGWGSAISDHAASCNGNVNLAPGFSIAGSSSWLDSETSNYITLNGSTNVELMFGYADYSEWIPQSRLNRIRGSLQALIGEAEQSSNPQMVRELAHSLDNAQNATTTLHRILRDTPLSQMEYDGLNRFAGQLHMVARLIAVREQLGMQQQVFFVQMGGWDTHADQNQRLPALFNTFNEGINAFQNVIDDIGQSSTVTAFTASDFGRTLTSNGNGTDHGWGGHNFVFGDAVAGGRVYGTMPSYTDTNNPDDAGDNNGAFAGRIIPTISVSQYGATLARWMGVDESRLAAALPDLNNFSEQDLGFFL
ncbi:MAG: DUF1501 domain-containing protein [Gammaproteobacteria bacterium]|nr:DUF1501 domain-containing protein [Gammaproteobacteria bacterium]